MLIKAGGNINTACSVVKYKNYFLLLQIPIVSHLSKEQFARDFASYFQLFYLFQNIEKKNKSKKKKIPITVINLFLK